MHYFCSGFVRDNHTHRHIYKNHHFLFRLFDMSLTLGKNYYEHSFAEYFIFSIY